MVPRKDFERVGGFDGRFCGVVVVDVIKSNQLLLSES